MIRSKFYSGFSGQCEDQINKIPQCKLLHQVNAVGRLASWTNVDCMNPSDAEEKPCQLFSEFRSMRTLLICGERRGRRRKYAKLCAAPPPTRGRRRGRGALSPMGAICACRIHQSEPATISQRSSALWVRYW